MSEAQAASACKGLQNPLAILLGQQRKVCSEGHQGRFRQRVSGTIAPEPPCPPVPAGTAAVLAACPTAAAAEFSSPVQAELQRLLEHDNHEMRAKLKEIMRDPLYRP